MPSLCDTCLVVRRQMLIFILSFPPDPVLLTRGLTDIASCQSQGYFQRYGMSPDLDQSYLTQLDHNQYPATPPTLTTPTTPSTQLNSHPPLFPSAPAQNVPPPSPYPPPLVRNAPVCSKSHTISPLTPSSKSRHPSPPTQLSAQPSISHSNSPNYLHMDST